MPVYFKGYGISGTPYTSLRDVCPSKKRSKKVFLLQFVLGFGQKRVILTGLLSYCSFTPIVEVCNCSMFCCTLLYVHSSIAIILMGKRELIALLNLSSWCLVMVKRLFLAVLRGCLQFVIVVFPDHTHLLFLNSNYQGFTPS